MSIYGNWISHNIKLHNFPFNHVVINDFLNFEFYNKLISSLPNNVDNDFWYYCNPIEVKYVLDNKNKFSSEVNYLINNLSSDFFTILLSLFSLKIFNRFNLLSELSLNEVPESITSFSFINLFTPTKIVFFESISS